MVSEGRWWVQVVLLYSIHAVAGLVFVWDVWMTATGHDNDTVSFVMREWSRKYPEILIPAGYLMCHLFGR